MTNVRYFRTSSRLSIGLHLMMGSRQKKTIPKH
jgi:hypothetical protein